MKFMKTKGFTLVEIMVAIFVFSMMVLLLSSIFISAVQVQRRSFALQQLLSQNNYLMEYMSRSLRMARKELGVPPSCLSAFGLNYEITKFGKGIKFVNYQNRCQEFFWDVVSGRFKEVISGTERDLTSADVQILAFNIGPWDSWDQEDNDQPRVTFYISLQGVGQKAEEQATIEVQSTISQRNLDVVK